MNIFRHRLAGLPALVILATAVGCSATDGAAKAAVPSPDAKVTGVCRKLDKKLPEKVSGLERKDPDPQSALTAGWGDPAIILRCGVPRPGEMDDPEADGVDVNGVGWLLQKRDDDSFRLTTTLRTAYVEVTLPKERTDGGLGPLTDLAEPISRTIPKGVAG
ncbi:DUF3515 domain-containing protein [Streptomyces tsukubensis]|uniref:DUF3515 domain-containing protein n=1 Tax=Streptomyces tsukubensis TaxID=83656 RepID=A0A1V3ZZA2_9ACTN|nr:DUF3515 domain-containing protein [Streptomyces tsukubensis]OON71535.1 hypothetical protein B1H18_33515 [Streptomyces tsukubensis]QFR95937.1 DUF3515 family protein [Streptomyces tsukubensis]